jgi:hypothetical protein
MAGTPVGVPNLIPEIEDEEAKDEESRKRKLALIPMDREYSSLGTWMASTLSSVRWSKAGRL